MMDTYMRSQARQQAGTLTIDDFRRAQAYLKKNGWHGLHDQPPADARSGDLIDLVCIPKQSEWDRPDGIIEFTYARR